MPPFPTPPWHDLHEPLATVYYGVRLLEVITAVGLVVARWLWHRRR